MSNDLHTILAGYKRKLNHINRESCRVVSQKTHDRTPVDTSALADGWTPNVGSILATPGESAIATVTNALQLGDVYFYANGRDYARKIEYLSPPPRRPGITRYDPAHPYAMMRRSVAEWRQIVEEATHGGRSA